MAVNADPAKFFANHELQSKSGSAFALTESNQAWLVKAHQQRE